MITEGLVLAWFSMCGVMLYNDPRLWVILASSILFTTIRVAVVPLASSRVKSYGVMSTNNQRLWSNTFASMIHSVVSSVLAFAAIALEHSFDGDYVNRATSLEFLATAVSTGYFAYDTWDYVLNRLYIKSPGIVAHHVVILICYISALTKTVGVPLLSLALACELHSAFMHLRKLMAMSGFTIPLSRFLGVVWVLQWVSFFVARIVPHLAVTYLTYQGRSLFANQGFFGMALGGIVFIDALNAQLFVQVLGAFRKDRGCPKTIKSS
ncbi:hypothetical protein PINS_up000018 [Pythium insidiosum]|nr:hypothetical protein PINS_up000018 [Pythium insidiosum]